jgi:Bacterial dnaA protein helix-turn-helix
MLTAELTRPTPMQLDAHRAHKERQLRMRMAAAPPPPVPVKPERQADAHVYAHRAELAAVAYAARGDLPRVWMSSIQSVICGEYRLRPEELLSSRRQQRIVWPRQIAFYLCCKVTSNSLPEIGHRFGGKDDTTVLRGRRKVEERLSFEPGFQGVLDDLERKCRDVTDILGSLGRG